MYTAVRKALNSHTIAHYFTTAAAGTAVNRACCQQETKVGERRTDRRMRAQGARHTRPLHPSPAPLLEVRRHRLLDMQITIRRDRRCPNRTPGTHKSRTLLAAGPIKSSAHQQETNIILKEYSYTPAARASSPEDVDPLEYYCPSPADIYHQRDPAL